MGIIYETVTSRRPNLQHYQPEYNADGSEKHIVCSGARYHVTSWDALGARCSEPNCEINKMREQRDKDQS